MMNDISEAPQVVYDYFSQHQYFGRSHKIGYVENQRVKSLSDIINGDFDMPPYASSVAFIFNSITTSDKDGKPVEDMARIRTGEFFREGELLTKQQAEKILCENLSDLKDDDVVIRIRQGLFCKFEKDSVMLTEENGQMRVKAIHPAATELPEYLPKRASTFFDSKIIFS